METLLMLLAIVGASFAVAHVDGPLGVFAKLRNLVARVPVLGPMVLSTLTCNFCLGAWVSGLAYLGTHLGNWCPVQLAIWFFGGGTFNSLFTQLMAKLDIKQQ